MIKNSGYNLRFSLLFGGHLCIIKQRFLERSIERNRNMSASVRKHDQAMDAASISQRKESLRWK